MVKAIFGQAAHINSLIRVAADKEANYSYANVGWGKPHAITLWVATERARARVRSFAGSRSVEWWYIANCAPQASVIYFFAGKLFNINL
jgi:hypothetical protein